MIVWDKKQAYKITGHSVEQDSEGFRDFSLEGVYSYNYSQLTKDNYHDFEYLATGEMQAAIFLAEKRVKEMLQNTFMLNR